MVRTEWADVAEFQRVVTDEYARPVLAIRAVDGTYKDKHFARNFAWARRAARLVVLIVYSVHPRSVGSSPWRATFAQLVDSLSEVIGDAHIPNLVLMDDVETWNRRELRRDFSRDLEAKRQAEVAELHRRRPLWQRGRIFGPYYRWRDESRVGGYGNRGDLEVQAIDSNHVRWRWIILADYTPGSPTPATFKGWKVRGRQYTNGIQGDPPHGTAPFGQCDMNRADVRPRRLARQLGLGRLRWSRT